VFRSTRLRPRSEEGFTLIEVVVAISIVMVVVTALLPQLVAGIRATGTARTVSQAKGVVQGQLDRMRNLPFYVSPAAGDHKDVLDYYFRDTEAGAAPTCIVSGKYVALDVGATGYVRPGGARCSYEPATGAFYRSVTKIPPAPGTVGFTVVVSTQFLTGATPPQAIAPPTGPTGYNSQSPDAGEATPLTSQIGVSIAVLYSNRGTVHPVTSYTQLYDQPTSTMRTRAEVGATTLEVGSSTESNGAMSLSAGLLNLVGSLTYASTVTGNLNSVSASFATGQQGSGAAANVAAPPATAASTLSAGAGT
jgi:type II secretory pathway pseudopilin PulG